MGQSPEQKRKREERRNEVLRRLLKNETDTKIAKEMGISRVTVSADRRYLEENNRIKKKLSKEEKLDITEEMTRAGKSLSQIAKRLGTTRQVVFELYRKPLVEQGKLTGEEKSIQPQTIKMGKRLKKLEKILEKETEEQIEIDEEDIAKQMGVSKKTVERDKVRLRERKEQEFAEWSEKVIKLYDNFYGQPDSVKKFEKYLIACKKGYEQRLIEEEHLLPIKCAAIATENYSNVAFYIKLCIRFSQFEEAIQFAKGYVSCETFSQEEKGRIKQSIAECEKFCQAIRMMDKVGISDEEIIKVTGLTKVEIALLRKKVEKRTNGDGEMKSKEEVSEVRNNEENDDGDEPEIA